MGMTEDALKIAPSFSFQESKKYPPDVPQNGFGKELSSALQEAKVTQ